MNYKLSHRWLQQRLRVHPQITKCPRQLRRETSKSISKQSVLQSSDVWPSTDRSQLCHSLREKKKIMHVSDWPNDNLRAAKLRCTVEPERTRQDFCNQLSIRVFVSENFSEFKVLWKPYREKSCRIFLLWFCYAWAERANWGQTRSEYLDHSAFIQFNSLVYKNNTRVTNIRLITVNIHI